MSPEYLKGFKQAMAIADSHVHQREWLVRENRTDEMRGFRDAALLAQSAIQRKLVKLQLHGEDADAATEG